ncbi:unnamed protein product [Gadus morhua 'NCC']
MRSLYLFSGTSPSSPVDGAKVLFACAVRPPRCQQAEEQRSGRELQEAAACTRSLQTPRLHRRALQTDSSTRANTRRLLGPEEERSPHASNQELRP